MSTDGSDRTFSKSFVRSWAGLVALIAGLTVPVQAGLHWLRAEPLDVPGMAALLVLALISATVWLALRRYTR